MFHPAAIPVESAMRTSYELARLARYDDERWLYGVFVLVGAGILAFIWTIIRRDSVEQRPLVRGLLFALRLGVFLALLLFFLHPQRRTIHQIVNSSKVLLMLDVSQSMGLPDGDASDVAPRSRMENVAVSLADGPMLDELRRVHDVEIYTFDREIRRIASLPRRVPPADGRQETSPPGPSDAPSAPASADPLPDLRKILVPQGSETKLGESLRSAIVTHRSAPISALIAVSDGGHNAGVNPTVAIELAREAEIPIHAVGVGSAQLPANVRVADLVAPARAYPGDTFTITGYIQAYGLEGRTVTLDLISTSAASQAEGQGNVTASQRVTLAPDGQIVPVTFPVTEDTPGRRTFQLRASTPPEDRDARDNQQSADVEIVGRETRVLLLASAATREYQFVRNLLWRDPHVTVDVLLQSSVPGISQDADQILHAFPESPQELYPYDVILAMDADWSALGTNNIRLLETWVSDEAGGLVIVAGPIHTARSAQDAAAAPILDLYPIQFQQRLALLEDTTAQSRTAWPIEFTREGLEAGFLHLEDTAPASLATWFRFPGIHRCFPAKEAKPGATVYGRFSDAQAGVEGKQPVFLAEQFYGAGRVFYIGSGELWRLRSLDEAYFEKIYTQLVRHVGQGRLLRGSSRGVLLLDRDHYRLGDTVIVRSQLSDAQHQPLNRPDVALEITRPDGTAQRLVLARDPSRPGTYAAQFTVLDEGAYRIVLPVPDADDEQLVRHIQVRVPDRERENPVRNDALLSEIAAGTGGSYYIGLGAALGMQGVQPLASRLRDRSEASWVASPPDPVFQLAFSRFLVGATCGMLCLEWLIRRLCRMA